MAEARNKAVDIIRAIAIILVMTGHCIFVNTKGAEGTVFFNLIWSLQMPLFFLVSGYVTKYSKPLQNAHDFFLFFKKRTLAYLLPWVVWTVLMKGIVISRIDVFSLFKTIVYNMDSGYWFLFSLWVICMIYGVGTVFANKVTKNRISKIVTICFISILLAGILGIAGFFAGWNFLGIKLTLYYLPFFYVGFIAARLEDSHKEAKWYCALKQWVYLPALIFYGYILYHHNLYIADDSVLNIIIRVTASLTGCYVVIYAVVAIEKRLSKRVAAVSSWIGQHSLEFYLVHLLFLSLISTAATPLFWSLDGIMLAVTNFAVMIILSSFTIYLISANRWSKLIFFGKK